MYRFFLSTVKVTIVLNKAVQIAVTDAQWVCAKTTEAK